MDKQILVLKLTNICASCIHYEKSITMLNGLIVIVCTKRGQKEVLRMFEGDNECGDFDGVPSDYYDHCEVCSYRNDKVDNWEPKE